MSIPYDSLSEGEQKILSIVQKVPSAFSISGSLYIICMILGRDRAKKLKSFYTRLLLSLSVTDVILGITYFMSSWPIPKDTIYNNLWGNIGNQTTCDMQGFALVAAGVGSMLYTSSLSLYFLLFIRYKWTSARLKKIEPFIHVYSITIPLVLGVVGWVKALYNPGAGGCGVVPYPVGCGPSSGVDCVRGENGFVWRIVLLYVPIVASFTFIAGAMILLFLAVRQQEAEASRHSRQWGQEHNRNTRLAFRRACKFVGAFFVAWTPFIVSAVISLSGSKNLASAQANFVPRLIKAILSPLQGFLNAIVYADLCQTAAGAATGPQGSASASVPKRRRHSSQVRNSAVVGSLPPLTPTRTLDTERL